MKLRSLAFGLLALSAMATVPAHAALKVDITQSSDSAIPIAIVPFQANVELKDDVAAIASEDLKTTGLFKIFPTSNMPEKPAAPDQVDYDDWRDKKVDNLVVGKIDSKSASGYKLNFNVLDVTEGENIAGYQLTESADDLTSAGHMVANKIYERLVGKKGYFLSRIAYVTVTGNNLQNRKFRLVVSDYDGDHPQTVYTSNDPVMSPAWSPDGRQLAYVAYNVQQGRSSVRVQDLSSGKVRTVATGVGVNSAPSWSPDGKQIVLTKSHNGNSNLYVYTFATDKLQPLTKGSGIDTEPTWSPDGKHIAFTSDRGGRPQIYQMDTGGNGVKRLTYDGQSNQRADYSPDGKHLAMVQKDDHGYRIAVMDLETDNVRVVSDGSQDDNPSFAPNGQAIIYAKQNRQDGLATVSLDGDAKSTLSQAGSVRSPSWGPLGY